MGLFFVCDGRNASNDMVEVCGLGVGCWVLGVC